MPIRPSPPPLAPPPCRSYVDSRGIPDTIAALTDLAGRCGYRFTPDPLLTQVTPPHQVTQSVEIR